MDVDAEIARLTDRRAAIWRGAESYYGEADKIAEQLAALYEQRRHERLVGRKGRQEILRHARVETELERLLTRKS